VNIFYLDKDPELAALYHHDMHQSKMISEARQMMNIACKYAKGESIKGMGFVNHPSTIWVRKSTQNYLWLKQLCFHLNNLYVKKFNKKEDHKSWSFIESLGNPNLPNIGFTSFALAMPDRYKTNDPVMSYRLYYFFEKRYYGKKVRRKSKWYYGKPEWIKELEKEVGDHEFIFD